MSISRRKPKKEESPVLRWMRETREGDYKDHNERIQRLMDEAKKEKK